MIIEKLHIYGFGKFEDTSIQLRAPIHFVTGENEAGKSTIHAFIQAVLFGFPTKNEKSLRYDPISTKFYGGNLTLQMNDGCKVVIERVLKNKSKGDVTVYLEDGSTYGENWLQAYLKNIDRNIFQAIFSFDLEGLSKLQQLKGEDLNQYIYEAGVTGTRKVSKLEKEINDNLDRLFKPKGQKPLINQKIKKLQDKRLEMREWELEFHHYNQLITDKAQIEKELEELKKEKRSLQKEKDHYHRKRTLFGLIHEKTQIEMVLNELEKTPRLTVEEEEKYKELSQVTKSCQAALEDITYSINKTVSEYENIKIHWRILMNKNIIYEMKEKLPLYRKLSEDLIRTQLLLNNKSKEAETLFNQLDGSMDELVHANTSIASEEELIDLEERAKELRDRIRTLEEQNQQEERQLRLFNTEITELESKKNNNERSINRKSLKYDEINRGGSLTLFLEVTAIILFSIGVWELVTGQPITGFILLSAGAAVFLLCFIKQKFYSSNVAAEQQEIVNQDWQISSAIKELKWQRDRTFNRIQILKDSIKENNQKWAALERELDEWMTRNRFPWIVSLSSASYHFKQVKNWQSMNNEINMLRSEENTINHSLEETETDVQSLITDASIEWKDTVEATVNMLIEKCDDEVQLNHECLEKADQLKKLYLKRSDYQRRLSEGKKEIEFIFKINNIETPEELREAVNSRIRYEQSKQKEEWFANQIEQHLLPNETEQKWKDELMNSSLDEKWDDEFLEEVTTKEETLHRLLADINQKIGSLEAAGTYENMLQSFEGEKAALSYEAEKWLVLSTARKMIRKAKNIYEEERQPKVIQKASEYFSYITAGQGRRLFAPAGEEKFVIEDCNGNRFTPEELSRGTAEQLYLSLRLALAESFMSSEDLPLILDDPFVNFDNKRQLAAFSLLKRFSQGRQVIYFTCHSLPGGLQHNDNITLLTI